MSERWRRVGPPVVAEAEQTGDRFKSAGDRRRHIFVEARGQVVPFASVAIDLRPVAQDPRPAGPRPPEGGLPQWELPVVRPCEDERINARCGKNLGQPCGVAKGVAATRRSDAFQSATENTSGPCEMARQGLRRGKVCVGLDICSSTTSHRPSLIMPAILLKLAGRLPQCADRSPIRLECTSVPILVHQVQNGPDGDETSLRPSRQSQNQTGSRCEFGIR